MKFIMTFFWTFILAHMLTYVVSSMIGAAYDFTTGTILGIAAPILIMIIPAIIPEGPAEEAHH